MMNFCPPEKCPRTDLFSILPFIAEGYRDWNHALDASIKDEYSKGFKKHELSDISCKNSAERIARETKNKKIERLLVKPNEDHIV